jgi:CBS domain containing-hemolysin-like protein
MVKIIFASIDKAELQETEGYIKRCAVKIESLQEQKTQLAATVSLGKTFSNIAFALLLFRAVELIFNALPPYQGIFIALAFSLVALTYGAHVVPRAFALRYYRKCIPLSLIVYTFFSWFFLPLVSIAVLLHKLLLKTFNYDEKFSFLSDNEKMKLVESTEDETSLDDEEKEMIHSIFRLGDMTVEEIMVPRINISGLDITSDFETTLEAIREEGHSRFPVFKETIDSIMGILYAKEVLTWISENAPQSWDLNDIIKKPHFVPMSKKVDDLMREFKKDHIHIAVVVDEYGGTAGIVTMEDILEEIVGEIHDEYDSEEKPIIQIAKNAFRVDPHIDLADLSEKLKIPLLPDASEVDYTTLSGLIYHECGTIPTENTSFEFKGLRIKIMKMDNQRIEKVEIEILSKPSIPPAPSS